MVPRPRPGCVIPGTAIACDFWNISGRPGIRLFFLSHAHSDHMQGLTPSWWKPIYCSPVTAKILKLWFHFPDSLLKPLELGESHLVEFTEHRKPLKKKSVSVTVLDANHSPGSVMFLFEGEFGRVLYTGDFRYDPEIFASKPYEELFSPKMNFDIVYLDNTYLDCDLEFPSRRDAAEEVKEIIRDHPNSDILLALTRLGKEQLLYEIARDLKELIFVSYEKYELLDVLEVPLNSFTKYPEEARIRVINKTKIMNELRKHEEECDYEALVIVPSALPFAKPKQFLWMTESKWSEKIWPVKYSDHCSKRELCKFLSRLKIRKISPFSAPMATEQKMAFQNFSPLRMIFRSDFVTRSASQAETELGESENILELLGRNSSTNDSDTSESGSDNIFRIRRKRRVCGVSGRPKHHSKTQKPMIFYGVSPAAASKPRINGSPEHSNFPAEMSPTSGTKDSKRKKLVQRSLEVAVSCAATKELESKSASVGMSECVQQSQKNDVTSTCCSADLLTISISEKEAAWLKHLDLKPGGGNSSQNKAS